MSKGTRDYIGDSRCECGKEVPVYRTGGGMLTTSCGWCRLQCHRPVASSSGRSFMGKVQNGTNTDEAPAVPVAPKPQAKAPPKNDMKTEAVAVVTVAPKAEKTIFDIFK